MQKYADVVLDKRSKIVPNASVLVKDRSTGSAAPIYSRDGSHPLANPMQADSLGGFEFYAANGRYDIEITFAGKVVATRTDVLLRDPADPTAANIVGGTIEESALTNVTIDGKAPGFKEDTDALDLRVESLESATGGAGGLAARIDEAEVAISDLQQFDTDLANDTDPAKGAGMVGHRGGTVSGKLDEIDVSKLSGWSSTSVIPATPIRYYEPFTRASLISVAAGTNIRALDNSTTIGNLTTGSYSLDSNGLTKTSANGSSVLWFDQSMQDIDVEITLRSIYDIGAESGNACKDANSGFILFCQDGNNYVHIEMANAHDAAIATLSVKELRDGVEVNIAGVSNIVVSAANPKFSNVNPTLRAIVRGNRLNVLLNGARVVTNALLTRTWGRHGLRVWRQGAVIKDLVIRTPQSAAVPSVSVVSKSFLYGNGSAYVGWSDVAPLNDGSVCVVWRESPLTTADGGHELGGSIKVARWRNGVLGAPVTLYSAAGTTSADIQEQDCILSRVYHNGNDYLVLLSRTYVKGTGVSRTYVSTCNISALSPDNPANWSARVEISFPDKLVHTAGHSAVIPSADGVGFLAAFYGSRVGDTAKGATLLAYSTNLTTWAFRSMIVDSLATSNPVTGGDYEPVLVRCGGQKSKSLFCFGRARNLISQDDGINWNQYDSVTGGRSPAVSCHFGGAIQTQFGSALMYRAYINATTAASHRIMPLQSIDGPYYRPSDWTNALEIDRQEYGLDLPGKANPGGDGGCLRAASIGGNRYLVTNYKQLITESAPRLYQYIIELNW